MCLGSRSFPPGCNTRGRAGDIKPAMSIFKLTYTPFKCVWFNARCLYFSHMNVINWLLRNIHEIDSYFFSIINFSMNCEIWAKEGKTPNESTYNVGTAFHTNLFCVSGFMNWDGSKCLAHKQQLVYRYVAAAVLHPSISSEKKLPIYSKPFTKNVHKQTYKQFSLLSCQ